MAGGRYDTELGASYLLGLWICFAYERSENSLDIKMRQPPQVLSAFSWACGGGLFH